MEESSLMNTAAGDHHDHELMQLPPGFRFHPTDEEIITHYLTKKVINSNFAATAIGEVDLNKCEPWDLPKRAKMGEKEWYFFCQKDRKYPTGMRTNRATQSGYWKATGKDKEIFRGKNCLVGMKKTLVFYRGRAPKGEKTNWVMHEYRLEGKLPNLYTLHKVAKDGWAVCRIFHKSTGIKKPNSYGGEEELSGGSLPSLVDPSYSGGPSNEIRVSDGSFLYNSSTIGPSHSALNNIMNQVTGRYGQMNPDQSMFYPHPGQTNMNNSHTIIHGSTPTPTPAQLFHQLGTMNNNVTQCKVEPNQSRSMVSGPSQDTGLSADLNPEISSSLSKQGLASGTTPFEDLMNPFFGGCINSDELGFSWDYL